jgi:hypothetical protein
MANNADKFKFPTQTTHTRTRRRAAARQAARTQRARGAPHTIATRQGDSLMPHASLCHQHAPQHRAACTQGQTRREVPS